MKKVRRFKSRSAAKLYDNDALVAPNKRRGLQRLQVSDDQEEELLTRQVRFARITVLYFFGFCFLATRSRLMPHFNTLFFKALYGTVSSEMISYRVSNCAYPLLELRHNHH